MANLPLLYLPTLSFIMGRRNLMMHIANSTLYIQSMCNALFEANSSSINILSYKLDMNVYFNK